MKISAIMVTLGRPHLVEQSIRMFELQTYQDRELLVIDTANQMPATEGDRWRVIPQKVQDWSQGETVNNGILSASGDVIARWDDDDTYFPWHLEACAEALAHYPWACPSVVWDQFTPTAMILTKTARKPDSSDVCYAGAWSFHKSAWDTVGRYPTFSTAEKEVEFRESLFRRYGSPADTVSQRFPAASYCYSRSRSGEMHDSETTDEQRLARRRFPYPKVATVRPCWPKNYLLGFPANPPVVERKW